MSEIGESSYMMQASFRIAKKDAWITLMYLAWKNRRSLGKHQTKREMLSTFVRYYLQRVYSR